MFEETYELYAEDKIVYKITRHKLKLPWQKQNPKNCLRMEGLKSIPLKCFSYVSEETYQKLIEEAEDYKDNPSGLIQLISKAETMELKKEGGFVVYLVAKEGSLRFEKSKIKASIKAD